MKFSLYISCSNRGLRGDMIIHIRSTIVGSWYSYTNVNIMIGVHDVDNNANI